MTVNKDFKLINCAIACSGGKDSNLLLHTLNSVNVTPSIIINHRIRKNSSSDSLFILSQHQQLKIPSLLLSITASSPENGIQEWARIKRYELLYIGGKLHNKKYITTAHHLNDQLETLLMRIKRKSKAWGQACMPYLYFTQNIAIWRPFLSFSTKQMNGFNKSAALIEVKDSANLNTSYTRIKIRNFLLKSPDTVNRLKNILVYRTKQRINLQNEIFNWHSKYVKIDCLGQAWLNPEFIINSNFNIVEARAMHTLVQLITASKHGPRWSNFLEWWKKCRNSNQHSESYLIRIQKKRKTWNIAKSITTNDYLDAFDFWDKRFKFSSSGVNFLFSTSKQNNCLYNNPSTKIKEENKLYIIPMAKIFTKAIIKNIYGIAPKGGGWKTLPIIIRSSKHNPVNEYNSSLLEEKIALLKLNTKMDYIGCPINGYDKDSLKKRYDIDCNFINVSRKNLYINS